MDLNLPLINKMDHQYATANVSQRSRDEPAKIICQRNCPRNDGRENLRAARDAMREMPDADDKSQQIHHGNLTDRPMTGCNGPGDQRDQPSANDSAPKKVRG